MKRLAIIFFLLLAGFPAGAQFFSSGEDPGGVKWKSISSEHFRIIYPEGTDSLALQYGLALERYRIPVEEGIGYAPNALYRRPMPVVLHPYSAQANGSVIWAPRRMDLFTRPQAVSPEPQPWVTELAVHESRHVAQMQFARERGYGMFNILTGELFTGAMSALYPGPALLEGDAVVAETELTGTGRGRTADFLEYYRVSFAEGDYRDWYRWRWGSQKLYTPDHYRAGYMLIAGTRYVYDDPLFMKRYYENIISPRWPFPFFVLQRTLRQASGKDLKGTWTEIAEAQQGLWAADEAARGPFGPSRQLTAAPRRFAEYLSPEAVGEDVFALRRSIATSPRLVRIGPDGRESSVRPFASSSSQLRYSENLGRLFWSEKTQDHRWTLKTDSHIFYLEPDSRKAHRLTDDYNLANPAPAPDGPAVATTEYPVNGGSAVRVIDGNDGSTLHYFPAPDRLQVVETAWMGDRLVASAISAGGFAFYYADDGFQPITSPTRAKVKQLRSGPDHITFVCDAGGVNELYRLDGDGTVTRLTNHRFGASDFLPSGDSLTFAALTPSARHLYREAKIHSSPSAPQDDKGVILSEAPVILSEAKNLPWLTSSSHSSPEGVSPELFSTPAPYRKLPHLLRLHSWAPVYVNYDAVANASFESLYSAAGLGATAFLQNDLGTASAIVGYSASRSVVEEKPAWNHSLHAQFTYRGLYPVFELSTDIGKGNASRYRTFSLENGSSRILSLSGDATDTPALRATARIYIPWDFSSSGWYRGVIPRLDIQYTNDLVHTGEIRLNYMDVFTEGKNVLYRVPVGAAPGRTVPRMRATAGVRGYVTLGRARSAIYPRWGIGAEGGFSMRPGATNVFSQNVYFLLYGYLPGLMEMHGIRLSGTFQARTGGVFPDAYLNLLPRGMSHVSAILPNLMSKYGSLAKLSADYALPLLPVDWSGLGPVAYLRNFELTLHADATASVQPAKALLYSAGADFAARLGNLLWIPYDTRIGVSYNFNGGSFLEDSSVQNLEVSKHRFSLLFSISLP